MIDQIIPRYLTTNEDERLVGEGAMLQAQNVSFVEDGEGTMLVMKNAKGTITATPADGSAIANSSDVRVIGSVSDDQRGFIYFFVCGVASANDHAIYQYNTQDNTYRVVIKDDWLNFSKDSYVKADVVNRNFQQDNVLQTIVYFTDNLNPPRKINIDRALAGDYSFSSNNSRDHALGAIKAPLVMPVEVSYETDYSVKANNFYKTMFQFTTQLVYKDGEESALSPYSKVAISSNIGAEGLDDPTDLSGSSFLVDNVLNITIPYTSSEGNSDEYRPEVSLIRLFGRNENDGPWLKIDEFDPSSSKRRDIYGSSKLIYDSSRSLYKFYNEGVYSGVSDTLKNKTYDNVPLLAEGQTVVGNRLMYSNYLEGRANAVAPDGSDPHQIQVKYAQPGSASISLNGDTESASIFSYTDGALGGEVVVNLGSAQNYSSGTDDVADGSVVEFKASLNPRKIDTAGQSGTGGRYQLFALTKPTGDTGNPDQVGFHDRIGIGLDFQTDWGEFSPDVVMLENESDPSGSEVTLDTQFVVGAAQTVNDVLETIKTKAEDVEKVVEYSVSSAKAVVLWYNDVVVGSINGLQENDNGEGYFPNIGSIFDVTGLRFDVTWGLNAVVSGATIKLTPYPKLIKWTKVAEGSNTLPSEFQEILPINNLGDFTTQEQNMLASWTTDSFGGGFDDQDLNISTTSPSNASSKIGKFDIQFISGASADESYLKEKYIQIENKASVLSYKAGANHDLGVVYYDKYGRHGFVNKIGQFYAKTLAERTGGVNSGYGKVSAQIVWGYNAPDWAARWSIVYPGNSSFSDFTQYTSGSAFVPIKDGDNAVPDTVNKRLYLSFNTLDKFKKDKSPVFDYSFTEGDKLRIISHRAASSATSEVFPGSEYPYEFNVVDVVTLGDTDNPLRSPDEGTSVVDDIYKGKFLVLDAPNINGGAVDEDGNQVKYVGFDWHSVAKTLYGDGTSEGAITYPDTSAAVSYSRWTQEVLFEIVTPRKVEPTVYYEIGVEGEVKNYGAGAATTHGPPVTFASGDTHLRTRSCAAGPFTQGGPFNGWGFSRSNLPKNYKFRNKGVESLDASDFFKSDSWSQGKPHVTFERAAEVRRYNGITYSDAYEEDVSNLSLSSFNASLANFASLESRYGAAKVILNYDNDLMCLQENKVSRANVGKDVLRTASQESLVSLSTTVIGPFTYYQGDYGVGKHPESVLIYDGDVFFSDQSRRKVLRFNPNGGGVLPISDTDVSSLLDDEFELLSAATGTKKIVSGYDPRTSSYYVTLDARDDSSYPGITLAYDLRMRKWRGTYTFIPDFYANQNRLMYSCRYVDQAAGTQDVLFHRHEDNADVSNRNKFYEGATQASIIEVVSKSNPHMVKVFNALSIEGTEAWDVQITSELGQDTGASNMNSSTFEKKEGQFYRSIPGDVSANSTSHIHSIGKVASVDGSTITLENNIHRMSLPEGVSVIYTDGSAFLDASDGGSTISSVSLPNKITLSSAPVAGIVGKEVMYKTDQSTDGDKIRGHFAKIKLSNTNANLIEIFSVNSHFTNSKLNHALGQ